MQTLGEGEGGRVMDELKPCPFCRGKDLSIYLKGTNDRKYAVCCNTCDARGGRGQSKGKAVEEWNRRVSDDT